MQHITRRGVLLSTGAVLALAACGRSGTQQSATTTSSVLNRGNGGEPASLDPHYITATNEDAIISDMLMGLVTADARAQPIPGAAERWEISADGLVWTFHLRDHLWSDGTPVTAEDFLYGWRRILDPGTAAVYAQMLYPFKNGEAISGGKMPPEALGAKALDPKTIELQLENPAPYLPQLLMHATTYPLPRHVVDARGKDWTKPGNYVGNGPYTLAEWQPNDHITLTKNPKFYDAANVRIERVIFYPIQDPDAGLKRFRAGEFDTQDSVPTSQIAFVEKTLGSLLHKEPYLANGYLVLNQQRKALADVRVRTALNLGYDRETMAKVQGIGQQPAYSLIPPGIANYPGGPAFDFKTQPQSERILRAQELMRHAGYGPDRPLKINLTTGVSTDTKRIAAAVQELWKQIYVVSEIVQTDAQVYSHDLQTGNFDVAGYGWVADYNDARNFLFLFLTGNPLNFGRYSNPAFDALIRQSDQEQDLAKRGEILVQAETLLLKDYAMVPTRFQLTLNLVQPYVKGWITNVSDTNRTRWLSIERTAA